MDENEKGIPFFAFITRKKTLVDIIAVKAFYA